MKQITCIEDLRQLHKRRVPKAFFDYADRGSYTEDTLRAYRADLEAIKFRQRILADVSKRDPSTTILGEPASLPLILAPVGLLGMQHGDGEIAACRAAQAAGIPFTLSTMSICSIEDVAAAVDKPFWFQLYVMRDRGFAASLIQRAKNDRSSARVLTPSIGSESSRPGVPSGRVRRYFSSIRPGYSSTRCERVRDAAWSRNANGFGTWWTTLSASTTSNEPGRASRLRTRRAFARFCVEIRL